RRRHRAAQYRPGVRYGVGGLTAKQRQRAPSPEDEVEPLVERTVQHRLNFFEDTEGVKALRSTVCTRIVGTNVSVWPWRVMGRTSERARNCVEYLPTTREVLRRSPACTRCFRHIARRSPQ